jgi:hypothetical protein
MIDLEDHRLVQLASKTQGAAVVARAEHDDLSTAGPHEFEQRIIAPRLPDAVKLFSDALYKDMLKPYERWVDALLIGKDKGWMAANVITSYLQPPTKKEALGLQLLALRGMCVAGDPRAGVWLKRLGNEIPENPDYLLAKSEY